MEEGKPIFKFKKTNAKLVGGINILDTNVYDYLEARGFASEVKFLHIKKMWNIVETQDELDKNMNVVKPGVRRQPEFHVIRGFIKDGKLVAEKTQVLKGLDIANITDKYSGFLRECMSQGWKRDKDMYDYFGRTEATPTYHMAANNTGFNMNGLFDAAKTYNPPTQQQMNEEAAKRAAENAKLVQDQESTTKSNPNLFKRILKTIKIG